MRNLRSPALMWIKAGLFLAAGLLGAAGILLEQPRLRTAMLLAISVWCFARAYYFAFHVIERYVDSGYRFTGLWSLVCYVLKRGRRPLPGSAEPTLHPSHSELPL